MDDRNNFKSLVSENMFSKLALQNVLGSFAICCHPLLKALILSDVSTGHHAEGKIHILLMFQDRQPTQVDSQRLQKGLPVVEGMDPLSMEFPVSGWAHILRNAIHKILSELVVVGAKLPLICEG